MTWQRWPGCEWQHYWPRLRLRYWDPTINSCTEFVVGHATFTQFRFVDMHAGRAIRKDREEKMKSQWRGDGIESLNTCMWEAGSHMTGQGGTVLLLPLSANRLARLPVFCGQLLPLAFRGTRSFPGPQMWLQFLTSLKCLLTFPSEMAFCVPTRTNTTAMSHTS